MKSDDIAKEFMRKHNLSSLQGMPNDLKTELADKIRANMKELNIYDDALMHEHKTAMRKKTRAALDSLVTDAFMMELATVGLCLVGTKEQQEQSSTILLNTMDACNDLQELLGHVAFTVGVAKAVLAKQAELRKLQEDISE